MSARARISDHFCQRETENAVQYPAGEMFVAHTAQQPAPPRTQTSVSVYTAARKYRGPERVLVKHAHDSILVWFEMVRTQAVRLKWETVKFK